MSMAMKNAWPALAIAAIAVCTGPAQAQNNHDTIIATGRHMSEVTQQSIIVRYSDLNLRDDAGAKKLGSRVRTAAEDVCNVEALQIPSLAAVSRSCFRTTLIHANQDVAYAIDRARSGQQVASNDVAMLTVRRR